MNIMTDFCTGIFCKPCFLLICICVNRNHSEVNSTSDNATHASSACSSLIQRTETSVFKDNHNSYTYMVSMNRCLCQLMYCLVYTLVILNDMLHTHTICPYMCLFICI